MKCRKDDESMWLWGIPLLFWASSLLIMLSGEKVSQKVGQKRTEFAERSRAARRTNPKESVYLALEQQTLRLFPWYVIRLLVVIVGIIFFVFGISAFIFIISPPQ